MLDRVLLFIKDALDAHLQRRLSLAESVVVMNHVRSGDGSQPHKNQNRIVMTMTNLEYDTARKTYFQQNNNAIGVTKEPPQFFNINVLFSSNFDDYSESLKILSCVIEFFQANNVFTNEKYPQMPIGIPQLEMEVENSSDARAFEMWNALGAHYVPSIIYKIRRIVVDSSQIAEHVTPMRQPVVGVGHG